MIKNIKLTALLLAMSALFCGNETMAQDYVEGLYGVGSVTTTAVLGGQSGVSGRYWSENFGADVGLFYRSAKVELEGTDVVDGNLFGINASFLAGLPMENFKPHVSAGFRYASETDELIDADSSELYFISSAGIDIAATERILFGLDLVQFNFALSGEVESPAGEADFEVDELSLFSGFRVGYRF